MVVLAHIVAVIMDGVALVMVVAGLHVNPLAELKGKKKT
jgi:hypothetical protein